VGAIATAEASVAFFGRPLSRPDLGVLDEVCITRLSFFGRPLFAGVTTLMSFFGRPLACATVWELPTVVSSFLGRPRPRPGVSGATVDEATSILGRSFGRQVVFGLAAVLVSFFGRPLPPPSVSGATVNAFVRALFFGLSLPRLDVVRFWVRVVLLSVCFGRPLPRPVVWTLLATDIEPFGRPRPGFVVPAALYTSGDAASAFSRVAASYAFVVAVCALESFLGRPRGRFAGGASRSSNYRLAEAHLVDIPSDRFRGSNYEMNKRFGK
jgi:hypothetical protein